MIATKNGKFMLFFGLSFITGFLYFISPQLDIFGKKTLLLRQQQNVGLSNTAAAVGLDLRNATVLLCREKRQLVFIKTHKTGSTTIASILERFGMLRNLSFALPWNGHVFSSGKVFNRKMMLLSPRNFQSKRDEYDLLVNHVRFSSTREMLSVVPAAKFITILRHPVNQMESAFGYFETAQHLKLGGQSGNNSLATFMENPEFHRGKNYYYWQQTKNGQLFDMGLDHQHHQNKSLVLEKIRSLDRDFDLVMINEYFDHSLLLLKDMMCWRMEDILYISKCIRSKSHRYPIDANLRERILAWNSADFLLYEHFNNTFWRKINQLGPSFYEDLALFRGLLKNVSRDCLKTDSFNRSDRREDVFVLNDNASHICHELLKGDVEYTDILRKRQPSGHWAVNLWDYIIGKLS